jgi:hypothetical protein
MGEDRQDFILCVGPKKRIEQDNPLRFAYPGEISIGMSAPFARIHPENASESKTNLSHQAFNSVFKLLVLEKFKFVEQGSDHYGEEP